MKRRPGAPISELLRAAARARRNAWAPYSRFLVGAAVLADGRIFAGCNVENSSYPLSVCAERNAVAAAVVAGSRRIQALAVVGGSSRPTPPCGGCRQVLAELADAEAPVVYAAEDGKRRISTTLGALLPSSFGAEDLREAAAESTGSSPGPSGRRRSGSRPRGTRSSGRSRSR